MIKNVIVVDEQGNEYGATYPKRAKGLVKNGRARFIDENKICLACPPDIFLEDNQMENNINNNTLTAKEIFDQIVKLQNQLTENSQTSLHRLGDVITDVRGENYENNDDIASQIESVCAVFAQREETMRIMLEFYRRMYEDIQNEKASKVDLIKSSFSEICSGLSSVEDVGFRVEGYNYIADKISEFVEKVLDENN